MCVCVVVWCAAGLSDFGLDARDVHNPRNGLLLPPLIEEHMECKRLCFQWDFLHNSFIICVSCPNVRSSAQLIAPSSAVKMSDLHGQRLHIPAPLSASAASAASAASVASLSAAPTPPLPFRRLLNWHADLCHEYAANRRWPFDALPAAPGVPYVFKNVIKLSPGSKWPLRDPPQVVAGARTRAASKPTQNVSVTRPLRHPVAALSTGRGAAALTARGRGAAPAAAVASSSVAPPIGRGRGAASASPRVSSASARPRTAGAAPTSGRPAK